MSQITTFSKFFYGHTVTADNRSIDFDEGGIELQADIAIGNYTLSEYATAIQVALTAAGTLDYAVTVDRATQKLTVSADSNFTLRCSSGSRTGTSAWALMGYDITTDKTGSNSYEAEEISGLFYFPQAILKDYTAAEDYPVKENAVKSVSARGDVQIVFFGDGARVEMEIRLATDKTFDSTCGPGDVETQANGVQNLRNLMSNLIAAGRCEFMPDRDNPNSFVKMILESADGSRQGTAFKLSTDVFPGFYTTKKLMFRVVQ